MAHEAVGCKKAQLCSHLGEGPFFTPSKERVKAYGDNLDTTADMSEVIGHQQLAELVPRTHLERRDIICLELDRAARIGDGGVVLAELFSTPTPEPERA